MCTCKSNATAARTLDGSWASLARVVRIGGFRDQMFRVEAASFTAAMADVIELGRLASSMRHIGEHMQKESFLSLPPFLHEPVIRLYEYLTITVSIPRASE